MANDVPTPKPEAEQKKLQGVWQFISAEQDGAKLGPEKVVEGKWVFEVRQAHAQIWHGPARKQR